MLAELLDNESRLADVAGRSLWHPNGFAKVVLLSQPSYKLRLHIWRNETAGAPVVAQENVHNHRWDFSTIPLAGSYRHQEFQPSADGEQFFAYKYCPGGSPGTYSLVQVGSQTLRCVFDAHLSQGSRFTISSKVLHRVIPDGSEATVSLVLQGPRQPFTGDVFASNEIGETEVTLIDALSPDLLRRQMNAVLSLSAFA